MSTERGTIVRHAGTVLVGQLAVMAFGIIDTVVTEPTGGAHRDPQAAINTFEVPRAPLDEVITFEGF